MDLQSRFSEIERRFYGFYDGIILAMELRYLPGGLREFELRLSCRDSNSVRHEGWESISLLVNNVREVGIREHSKTTLQVLSHGVHLRTFGEFSAIEFGGLTEPPESLELIKSSDAFVIGSGIQLQVLHPQIEVVVE